MGSGDQKMDFTHVSDVVAANVAALESEVENETFNVGYGKEHSVKEIAEMLLELLHSSLRPQFKEREVVVTKRRSDSRKLEKLLGVKCKVYLKDGLRELVEHVKKNPEIY